MAPSIPENNINPATKAVDGLVPSNELKYYPGHTISEVDNIFGIRLDL